MGRSTVITILCIVVFGIALIDGSILSSQNLDLQDISSLDLRLLEDVNLTELSLAIRANHPHATRNVVEVIELYEYKVEIHQVITSDEYILELHRITGNKKNPNPDGKPAVLLIHGLLSSSMDWVVAGPKKGFGFILADAGYDVWLGNVRGSRYSRKHRRLSVNEPKYWSFSWHEIGMRDLPAMIDHILEETEREKIFYAGHSQGSTAFFVMASELPYYNDKISAMFSLAPVAYCSRMFSPIFQSLARLSNSIDLLTKLIGLYEFKPTDIFFKKITSKFCKDNSIIQPVCSNILFLIAGYNKEQMDTSLLPAILAHVPAGAGVKQFVHYGQIIKSARFRQYDLGLWGNMAKYRRITPPPYNLKNVRAPVALHYSVNDWLSDSMDVEKLHTELPNPIGKFRVPNDKFNHIDFIWAKDVKHLLYDKIISIMQHYNS